MASSTALRRESFPVNNCCVAHNRGFTNELCDHFINTSRNVNV